MSIIGSNPIKWIFLMGQKTNSVGLRLKKRLNWPYTYNCNKPKDIGAIQIKLEQINYYTNIILSMLNCLPNNIDIRKNTKSVNVLTSFINHENIQKMTEFTTSSRFDNFSYLKSNIKNITLNKDYLTYNFVDTIRMPNKNKILNPKLITSFIVKVLNKDTILKQTNSNNNLKLSITKFLNTFLNIFKDDIVGVKVMCSGKWKKTPSGRKQKLVIKYGKICNASLKNIIRYDNLNQKTKFGAVGVKVWIASKNVVR